MHRCDFELTGTYTEVIEYTKNVQKHNVLKAQPTKNMNSKILFAKLFHHKLITR